MTKPTSSLLTLPAELFEIVASHLTDTDISWVRLSCHTLERAVRHRFLPRFKHKQTDLSIASLQQLVEITCEPEFSAAIEHLTIIASAFDTQYLSNLLSANKPERRNRRTGPSDEQIEQAKWEHSLLVQRQAEQAPAEDLHLCLTLLIIIFSQFGKLKTLALESGVYKMAGIRLPAHTCTDWKEPWRRAIYVYSLVMASLKQVGMRIEQFNLYGGHWSGSVNVSDFSAALSGPENAAGSDSVFKRLKRLSLCLSPEWLEEIPTQDNVPPDLAYQALVRSLVSCPELEELELHMYRLSNMFRGNMPDHDPLLEQLCELTKTPRLCRISLKGMDIRQDTLINFLRTVRTIRSLRFRSVSLTEGTWRNVYQYCADAESRIKDLSMEIVREGFDVLLFHHAGGISSEVFQVNEGNFGAGIEYSASFLNPQSRDPQLSEYGPPMVIHGRTVFKGIT